MASLISKEKSDSISRTESSKRKISIGLLSCLICSTIYLRHKTTTGSGHFSLSLRELHTPPPLPPPRTTSTTTSTSYRYRVAIVRPFSAIETEDFDVNFEAWTKFLPCDIESRSRPNSRLRADLFLSFSQSYKSNTRATKAANEVLKSLKKRKWGKCFENLYTVHADIPPEEDLYDPTSSQTDIMWVNGPNRQFEAAFRAVHSHPEYDLMLLMEADATPVKNNWLETLLNEAEKSSPFAILGSKYDGDSWDEFIDELPVSLVHHINGNALYNMTHPLLLKIVDELAHEARTPYNAIPYDYRISQIIYEASEGIQPEIPPKILENHKDVLKNNTKRFQKWWEKYGNDNSMKVSSTISNFAATNILPRHLNDASIIHGARHFLPHDPSKHSITLVISEWHDRLSSHILSEIDSTEHPFSQITLVLPTDLHPDNEPDIATTLPVKMYHRTSPDYMDLCDAPVSTEWFMITNAYHSVKPNIDLLFTPDSGKPVVSFTPSDEIHCTQYKDCQDAHNVALDFYPQLRMVVHTSEIIFKTSLRDEFCDVWKDKILPKGEKTIRHMNRNEVGKKVPTGTSYIAYLFSKSIGDKTYKFSSRTHRGARDAFVTVFPAEEEMSGNSALRLERRMQRKKINLNGVRGGRSGNAPSSAAFDETPSPSPVLEPRPTRRKKAKEKMMALVPQADELPCKSYCYNVRTPFRSMFGFSQKCDWKFSCAGCSECNDLA